MCVTHLIIASKLSANQQLGGDSPVGVLVDGGQERTQIEEYGRAENVHHAGQSRGSEDWRLEEDPESLAVVEPNFSADVPEAEVREDRTAKRRRRYTANFHQYHQCWETIDGDRRWWTRIGTSSARPATRASREWNGENLYYMFVEMNKEVKIRHPSGNSTARTLLEDEGGQRKR